MCSLFPAHAFPPYWVGLAGLANLHYLCIYFARSYSASAHIVRRTPTGTHVVRLAASVHEFTKTPCKIHCSAVHIYALCLFKATAGMHASKEWAEKKYFKKNTSKRESDTSTISSPPSLSWRVSNVHTACVYMECKRGRMAPL